ncbi:hypothetical protein BC938DRAFT_480808 [Jimgerdemannia flammicorona]|uniref:Uncharacterized protein n=1 Tax=Jimgerdemannia flammicorona TaxID=994334 RepID=A0A433QHR7_9FUNG|nr:hypothetical protein BC938DRAFT_480808 [Jimgerdemannia flammicorona]
MNVACGGWRVAVVYGAAHPKLDPKSAQYSNEQLSEKTDIKDLLADYLPITNPSNPPFLSKIKQCREHQHGSQHVRKPADANNAGGEAVNNRTSIIGKV